MRKNIVLHRDSDKGDVKLGDIMQPIHFVLESITLDKVLAEFLERHQHLFAVLDEYGGTAGIISLSDILELVFGPTVFARPQDEPSIVRRGDGEWVIDARANLDEINRELGVELEAGDADRLSGWVAYHAERLPHVGQEIEADGCRATILKRRRRRVVSVLLKVEAARRATDEEILNESDEEAERAEEDAR
jgi:magnesium and cobalt transporter